MLGKRGRVKAHVRSGRRREQRQHPPFRELVEDDRGAKAVYRVTGELFFASSNDLYTQFEYAEDPDRVVVDLSASHIWDASTVAALDAIVTKYERRGTEVEITGLNEASAERHARLTGELPSH